MNRNTSINMNQVIEMEKQYNERVEIEKQIENMKVELGIPNIHGNRQQCPACRRWFNIGRAFSTHSRFCKHNNYLYIQ